MFIRAIRSFISKDGKFKNDMQALQSLTNTLLRHIPASASLLSLRSEISSLSKISEVNFLPYKFKDPIEFRKTKY